MPQCPSCDRELGDYEGHCPECDDSTDDNTDEESNRLVRIARFSNAAEAGYFAHELAAQNSILTKIVAEESFDALCGYWSTGYALTATEADADAARTALVEFVQRLRADDFDDFDDEFDPSNSLEDSTSLTFPRESEYDDEPGTVRNVMVDEPGVNWIPVVLTLAAGSIVFWAARRIHDQPAVFAAPVVPKTEELWDYLAHDENPWVQELEGGVGVRQLQIDPQRKLFIIREDRDGDGRFESELNFNGQIPRH